MPYNCEGWSPKRGKPAKSGVIRRVDAVTRYKSFANHNAPADFTPPLQSLTENQDFCGHLTLCSCKTCQVGPDHEVMKGPDHVEIGEAESIVGVHDGCRDELRAGWRIATEQR